MPLSVRTADESTVRLFDGLVAAWLVLWLVVGGWSAVTMWDLSGLGDTVTSSGEAIGSAGEALESLGNVPVVGERPGELGRQTVVTGADIADRGQQVKDQLRRLSILYGLAIALMPTTPVVGLYLPLRLSRRRERRELARAMDEHADDPALERHLAERAIASLPFTTLRRLESDPYAAVAEGRTRRLARAELVRIGLHRGDA